MEYEYDFDRFLNAQNTVYEKAISELKSGKKQSHWMWYIFPQLVGLGHSQRAAFFGISDRAEAAAYLQHPILETRLIECTELTIEHAKNGALSLFSAPDDLKFQSCMSLFSRVKGSNPIFNEALNVFFGGVGDVRTLEILRIEFIKSLD